MTLQSTQPSRGKLNFNFPRLGIVELWLDACAIWGLKKVIGWDSSKFTIICDTKYDFQDKKISLSIGGWIIIKTRSATYLGMTLTSKGLTAERNEKMGNGTTLKTQILVTTAKIDNLNQILRSNLILEAHLLIVYTYNSFLIPSIAKLQKIDKYICKRTAQIMRKSKSRGLTDNGLETLKSLLHIVHSTGK